MPINPWVAMKKYSQARKGEAVTDSRNRVHIAQNVSYAARLPCAYKKEKLQSLFSKHSSKKSTRENIRKNFNSYLVIKT